MHSLLAEQINNGFKKNTFAINDKGKLFSSTDVAAHLDSYIKLFKKHELHSVIIVSHESIDSISLIYATISKNGVTIPLHSSTHSNLALKLLQELEADGLFIDKPLLSDDTKKRFQSHHQLIELDAFFLIKNTRNKSKSLCPGFIYYTSGTTGKPKALHHSYNHFSTLVQWLLKATPLGPEDKFIFLTNLGFFGSIRPLLMPLVSGGQIVIAPQETKKWPKELYAYLLEKSVTVLATTSSMFNLIAQTASVNSNQKNTVRLCLLFGESLNLKAISTWRKYVDSTTEFHSFYGSTEATVIFWQKIPNPITETKLSLGQIRDEISFVNKPHSPPYQTLCFSGGIATGFLDEAINHEKVFYQDEKRYIYSDDAFVIEGEAIFLGGRKKQLVNHLGQRINLRQIQEALLTIKSVQAVYASYTPENRIVAFVVAPSCEENTLRLALRDQLPQFMHPHHIEFIKEMPRNSSDKIDEEMLLKNLNQSNTYHINLTLRSLTQYERLSPNTPLQALNLSSIDTIELSQAVMLQCGLCIPLEKLDETTTIADLQKILSPLPEDRCLSGPIRLNRFQQLMHQMMVANPSEARLNITFKTKIKGSVDLKRLETAIQQTVANHPMLHCRVGGSVNEPTIEINPDTYRHRIYFPSLSRSLTDEQLRTYLYDPYLIRYYLYRDMSGVYILMTGCHLAFDGPSLFLTLEEIFIRYDQRSTKALLNPENDKALIQSLLAYESRPSGNEHPFPSLNAFKHPISHIATREDFNLSGQFQHENFVLPIDQLKPFIHKHQLEEFSTSTLITLLFSLATYELNNYDSVSFLYTFTKRGLPIPNINKLISPCSAFYRLLVPKLNSIREIASVIEKDVFKLSQYASSDKLEHHRLTQEGQSLYSLPWFATFTYYDCSKLTVSVLNQHIDWQQSELNLISPKEYPFVSFAAYNLGSSLFVRITSNLESGLLKQVLRHLKKSLSYN